MINLDLDNVLECKVQTVNGVNISDKGWMQSLPRSSKDGPILATGNGIMLCCMVIYNDLFTHLNKKNESNSKAVNFSGSHLRVFLTEDGNPQLCPKMFYQ